MKKRSWSTILLFLPAVVLILNDILLTVLPLSFLIMISFVLLLVFPAFIVGIACVLTSDDIQDKESDKVIAALAFNVFLWLWSFLLLPHAWFL